MKEVAVALVVLRAQMYKVDLCSAQVGASIGAPSSRTGLVMRRAHSALKIGVRGTFCARLMLF